MVGSHVLRTVVHKTETVNIVYCLGTQLVVNKHYRNKGPISCLQRKKREDQYHMAQGRLLTSILLPTTDLRFGPQPLRW